MEFYHFILFPLKQKCSIGTFFNSLIYFTLYYENIIISCSGVFANLKIFLIFVSILPLFYIQLLANTCTLHSSYQYQYHCSKSKTTTFGRLIAIFGAGIIIYDQFQSKKFLRTLISLVSVHNPRRNKTIEFLGCYLDVFQ